MDEFTKWIQKIEQRAKQKIKSQSSRSGGNYFERKREKFSIAIIEKINILTVNQKLFRLLDAKILFSPTLSTNLL